MGLLTIPKKYNPPGNGKRDMEYPIFATKQEMGLLKMRGGSGKMTKHGIRSFGLGDKGNSVGSAGGSNYSGDGQGGQVNLDGVGGKTGNVLRNIAGKWTIVDKATGAVRDSEGRAISSPVSRPQVQYTPTAAPVQQTITAPINVPSIPASTLAAQYGMYKNPTANMPATTTAPASYPNSMPGNVNQSLNYGPGTSSPTVNAVSPLGMGGTRGSWSTPASPSPNSMPGNSDPGLNYGPGTTPSTLQGVGGTRGSWATPPRPPNNTPSTPTSNGPQTRGQMPNYGAGPAVDPGMSNNASYFGDVSDFQGSTPPRTAITSMLAEAQRRAASNRLQEQYSQYRSPPGSPSAPTPNFQAASGRYGPANPNLPDPRSNVGNMDAMGLANAPPSQNSAYGPRMNSSPTGSMPTLALNVPDVPQGVFDRRAPDSAISNAVLGEDAPGWYSATNGIYGPDGMMGYPTAIMRNPASLADYNLSAFKGNLSPNKITASLTGGVSNPAQFNANYPNETSASNLSSGQIANNQTINDAVHKSSILNAVRSASPQAAVLEHILGNNPVGQQSTVDDDYNIDPTSSYPPEVQVTGNKVWNAIQRAAKKTPAGIAIGLGLDAYDSVANGQYYDDVSLGTDESGRRTDRASSGGGFSTSPGGFGPGGQDRRGAAQNPGHRNAPQGQIPEADQDFISTLPQAEQKRLHQLRRRDPRAYREELEKLKAAPPTGGGGTTPGTTGPFQWYYPQYQSTWAGLPVGLGGTYGRV